MRLEIRLNEKKVASLADFCQLENRYCNGSKPTSFVLQTGVDSQQEFLRELAKTDESLADLDRSARNWYYRTGLLEAFMEREKQRELQELSKKVQKGSGFPKMFENSIWETAYQEGAERILSEYQKQESAENRIRNFLVLLLYRIEYYFPKLFKNTRTLSKFPKFVYTGVCGTQEYYFLRLLCLCGCDVYCVHPHQVLNIKAVDWEKNVQRIDKPLEFTGKIPAYDIEQIRRQKEQTDSRKASHIPGNIPNGIQRGIVSATGTNQTPGNNRGTENTKKESSNREENTTSSTVHTSPVNLAHPGRKTAVTKNTPSPVNHPPVGNTIGGTRSTPENTPLREKSYEELASMAGSVVMIVVFNEKKEPFAAGSGVIINNNGYILTNFHVVQGAVAYGVKLEEEEEFHITNELIKYHPENDLALIRIEPINRPSIPVYQGSKLVRGQKVVAIGSPLGLMNTVSDGIIAGFRQFDDVSMIQFTAPTSHGSSGGALLNLQGELIGIVSASFDDGENLNLAVDFQVVRSFLQGFI